MTQDEVKELFEYREVGLYWKEDRYSNKVKGCLAGYLDSRMYRKIHVNRKTYAMHKLVYLYHHGYMPDIVDHINGCPCDNRIENLRDVSQSANAQNRSHKSKKSNTGIRNVTYNSKRNKYVVRVCCNYESKFIGEFTTLEEAEIAAKEARKKYHEGYTEQRETT
jgi:predicted RNase H-like HicB family nuclease